MESRLEDQTEPSIAELVHQLVEDGRALLRAELGLYREIAIYRAGRAKMGAVAIGIGAVLALAAPIVLLVMLANGLAMRIGPVGAGLVVAGATALVAVLLIRFGAGRLRALGGDTEEKKVLDRGQRRA